MRLLFIATALLREETSLLQLARRAGFASAEVLIRNFRQGWGVTPQQYRRRYLPASRSAAFREGLKLANRIAPCAGLYRIPTSTGGSTVMPMLSVAVQTLAAQPALIIRSRVARSEIAATIGQNLGKIVPYAMQAGGVLAGQPFARYPEYGPGMVSIEVGMPLAAPIKGEGEIEAFTLPAGRAAVAVHGGAYDQLPESYAALERWMTGQGHAAAGAPWEVYVSDPADHPDPADWRTQIVQPI
jgi:effector-binding domain-containing protein